MKIGGFILLFLASHSCSHSYKGLVEEVMTGIQNSLASSLKNMITKSFESLPMNSLLEKQTKYLDHFDEKRHLNSTTINQFLQELKNILPDNISIIPFAIVEPISNSILVFYATTNSSFVNITHFDSKVNINNSNSSKTITISLHINSSSLIGNYELDVSSYDMHLFGNGTYSVVSEGTDATFNMSVTSFEDDSFLMTDFSINITLAKAQIFMTNFLDGFPPSQPLLDLIGEMIPQEIPLMNDLFKETVNQTVTSFTNDVIAKIFSWREIVWIIEMFAKH